MSPKAVLPDTTKEWLHSTHDDVFKWKHFPHYWPFVRGIIWSMVDSPCKGQWRGALMFSLICAWTNGWANKGDLRQHHAHHDVIVMTCHNVPEQEKINWMYGFAKNYGRHAGNYFTGYKFRVFVFLVEIIPFILRIRFIISHNLRASEPHYLNQSWLCSQYQNMVHY